MEATSLWGRLREAASLENGGRLGLWVWLKEKVDLAQYRPEAISGVETSQLTGRDGEYYILKNPGPRTYYRLSERDLFLWRRMDGIETVKDLVVAYFLEYGSFAFARVATLVQGLKASLFLVDQPVRIYQQVRRRLEQRRPSHRLRRFSQALMQKQFAIGGLDGVVGLLYRWGGRLLYVWPLQVLYVMVSAVGLYFFPGHLKEGTYGLVTTAGSYWQGIVSLIVANLVVIVCHEMAHALTVKHYGREVRRGGFLLYFGLPAFFVDTMDIWMERKRARMAVSWAGPYANLIIGGLASIAINVWPESALNSLFFKIAFISYITVLSNLSPLLETDGYFILMDWLDIPMLRQKSLEFLRTGLWERLKRTRGSSATDSEAGKAVPGFSREQRIFAVFGLLSAAWTAYAIYLGVYFWQARLVHAIRSILSAGGSTSRIAAGLAAVAASVPFVLGIGLYALGLARKTITWAQRQGLLDNIWHVAAMVLAAAIAPSAALVYLRHRELASILGVVALAAAAYLSQRRARDYAGSRHAPVFSLLGLFLLGLLLSETGATAVYWGVLSPGDARPFIVALRHLAYAFLLLAGLLVFADTNLRQLRVVEKILVALGLLAGYGLVFVVVAELPPGGLVDAGALLDVSASLSSLLALTALVPTLFSFRRTNFGPAWATLSLSLCALLAMTHLGLHPLYGYVLLAVSLFLHHLAYTRVTFLRDQPQAALELSDLGRLQRASAWSVRSVLQQLREIGGEHCAGLIEERFNNYALAAGWRVSLVRGDVDDSLPGQLSLIERGEIYGAALTLLLDLTAQEIGEKLTVRILQTAYDALPWEEREIGSQYLFRDVRRATVLSREFEAVHHDYRGLLQRMPLFSTMDEAETELLCSRLRPARYAPGQVIIRQGEPGDRFYIVRRGHVEVAMRDERGVSEVVNDLDRGDYFGELALLSDAPRNATCRAAVPTEVLYLSREDFDDLVRARFALRQKLDRSIAQVDLLRRIPLFAEMDAQQIQLVSAQLREEAYEPGDTIIRQGEIGDTFYVVESGQIQVSVAQDGEERVVTERGPGEYVGEIALLLQVPRTATVRALTPTRTLALHKDDFDKLVVKHLYVSRGLERETSRRMIDLRRVAPVSQ